VFLNNKSDQSFRKSSKVAEKRFWNTAGPGGHDDGKPDRSTRKNNKLRNLPERRRPKLYDNIGVVRQMITVKTIIRRLPGRFVAAAAVVTLEYTVLAFYIN